MKHHKKFFGRPEDDFSLLNAYGTYNIQPTADTDNLYPAIAQGLPRTLNRMENKAENSTAEQ